MKKNFPTLCICVFSLAYSSQAFSATTATSSCPAPQSSSSMTLTFDSEFANSGAINPNQWHPYVGQHGTPAQELEVYIPSDVVVTKTEGLRLKTEQQAYWQHQYTSGQVTTQGLFSQAYGHFEMMARMPQANGMWPAFWLLPENGGWPPEIDVVEYIYAPLGKVPSLSAAGLGSNPQTTLHWPSASGADTYMAQGNNGFPVFLTSDSWNTTPAPTGLGSSFTGYHKYSVDWRPGSITYFIDDAPVFCVNDTAATGQRVPSMPMYMVLNDAITAGTSAKPGWAGFISPTQSFPLYFDIAYVKAYQFNDLHPAALPFDIQNIKLTSSTPLAASTDTITATIHIGPNSLGSGGVYFNIYNFINPQQYQGVKSTITSVGAWFPALNAGGTYNVKIPFNVPSSPGIYGIAAGGYYASGPTNGSGSRGAYMQQVQTFTVN